MAFEMIGWFKNFDEFCAFYDNDHPGCQLRLCIAVLHVSFMFLIIKPEALDQVHLEKAQRSRVQGFTSTSSTLDSCDFKSGYQAEAN